MNCAGVSPRLPVLFFEVMRQVKEILSSSPKLKALGVVQSEAEQLMIAAYRKTTQKSLSRLELYSKMKDPFPEKAAELSLNWSEMRVRGKLLQHLIGVQYFLNHEYEVGPEVLIPRPETEVLVSHAAMELNRCKHPPAHGIEIGVGSGIISIELLSSFPKLSILGSELTEDARVRARTNAERILGKNRVAESFRILPVSKSCHVWEPFEAVKPRPLADFVISNPPYLVRPLESSSSESEFEVDEDVLANEPATALFAPEQDPLFFYRLIGERASEFVKKGGFVFLELPHERALEIEKLYLALNMNVRLKLDLNERARVLIAQLKL